MLKVIAYIILLCLFVIGWVKYIERRNLFFPSRKIEITPEILRIPFEDVYLKTLDGVTINGWFIPKENAEYTVLFCHGNAGNISHRLEKIVLLRHANVNVFIIDYRGYGNSLGNPNEQGLYLDAQAAYDYLIKEKNIDASNIVLYGGSIGSAVAVELASRNEIGGLIIEGGFSSGRDIAKKFYPFLPAFLFGDKFNSLSKIKKNGAPKLFIHSRDDEVVPFSLAKKLYDTAQGSKKLVEVRGGHNTSHIDSQEIYEEVLKEFFERIKISE
ncbi:MAG: alpha/beta hydrolase [Candidatus Omnitrophota bacterium]